MKNIFSKEVLQFLNCFDGNIYRTVPDNLLVYELAKNNESLVKNLPLQ